MKPTPSPQPASSHPQSPPPTQNHPQNHRQSSLPTYPPSTLTRMRLSAIAGLISGIAWAIGDILLVGFKPNPTAYPAIMQFDLINDKQVATAMMEGSTQRLEAGALIAAFTIPLMLLALYHVWQLIRPAGRTYATASIAVLFVAFAYSPLAHASFFFVGEACKTAIQLDATSAAVVLKMAASFIDFLYITWYPAIGLTALGWLLISIIILRGNTAFPRLFGLLTPLPISVAFILIYYLVPSIVPDLLAGAGFNLAAIVFYLSSTIFCCGMKSAPNPARKSP